MEVTTFFSDYIAKYVKENENHNVDNELIRLGSSLYTYIKNIENSFVSQKKCDGSCDGKPCMFLHEVNQEQRINDVKEICKKLTQFEAEYCQYLYRIGKPCIFGEKCSNKSNGCLYKHTVGSKPRPCKYDIMCRKDVCNFGHPNGRNIDKLPFVVNDTTFPPLN